MKELAHRRRRPVHARLVDIEVRDKAQPVQTGGQHALRLEVGDQRVSARLGDIRQINKQDVGLRWLDAQLGDALQGIGQALRQGVVMRQARHMMVQRPRRGGGQHAGLAHGAAGHLADAPRACDEVD